MIFYEYVMEKNLILAVVLSIVVLLVFQFMFKAPVSIQHNGETEKEDKLHKVEEDYLLKEGNVSKIEKEISEKLIEQNKKLEKTFFLENDYLVLKFSNLGGQITEVYLKDYKTSEGELWPLLKISPFEIGVGKVFLKNHEVIKNNIWKVEKEYESLIFSLFLDNGIEVRKKFQIISPYEVRLVINVRNNTSDAEELQYSVFGTSNIYRPSKLDKRYSNILISQGNDKLNKISLPKVKKDITKEPGSFQWIAEKSSYFSMIFVPQKKMMSSLFYAGPDDFVATGGTILPSVVKGKEEKNYEYKLFFGPNDSDILEKFNPGCGKIVNFGIFTPISKFLLSILSFIFSIVHNYGIAIILLTLIVDVCLFPLTLKSVKSMKTMQTLQPHINRLRDEHKDDSQRLNKELMALYREKGGNPLGGCFPMLLQFPIFIALYLALTKSIELKGASFLWISDLAAPDAAFKIPFSLPFIGSYVNILPILMLIAMFIQQRITQSQTSMQTDMQKQFTIIMPIVFGFIFYHFPSGLVLYWLTNTVVMSLINWKILKAHA